MSFKIREEHINMYADFMENHIELARGRLSCSNAREQFKILWSELATNLNSLGFGVRTIEKWQRTWSDYKLNLKKRASELKKEQTRTGGGPPTIKNLSEIDCRILNILGKTFYQGCGVEEKGFEHFEKIQDGNSTQSINDHSSISNSENEVVPIQSTSQNIDLNYQRKRKATNADLDDHDYLATPRVQKKNKAGLRGRNNDQSINGYYEETIQLLRSIDNNLKNMNDTFKSLNSTVDKKFSELCQILEANKYSP